MSLKWDKLEHFFKIKLFWMISVPGTYYYTYVELSKKQKKEIVKEELLQFANAILYSEGSLETLIEKFSDRIGALNSDELPSFCSNPQKPSNNREKPITL